LSSRILNDSIDFADTNVTVSGRPVSNETVWFSNYNWKSTFSFIYIYIYRLLPRCPMQDTALTPAYVTVTHKQ